tara:strand:+ start:309 stop:1859 length:1551 start_codon:yes stop_codon:yes gene_type:complete
MTEILYGESARVKLLEGINLVSDTIKCTLGPQARTVILKQEGVPVIINDGVTIAKAVTSDDEFIQMGVELLQQVASQAQENSGDGTTTAAIIAQSICESALNSIIDGANPIKLKAELDALVKDTLLELDNMSVPIDSREMLENVASIAANNDLQLGELIADVVEAVGKDGIISVEDGHSLETTFEVIEGMELDNGFMSHLMVNNDDGTHCEFEDCLVLMSNETINNFQELLPVLEVAVSEKKPLVIMCKELEGTAFPNLLVNVMQKTLKVCAIKTPDFGDEQIEILKDIQSMIGGHVFNSDLGDKISNATLHDLGVIDKISIGRSKSTLIHDANEHQKETISDRVFALNKQMEAQTNDWYKEKIHRRIGRLAGGVALVKVGGSTEIELRETKERLDDALNATTAAIQEGVVVGGGLALYNISQSLKSPHDFYRIAIQRPIKQLADNSGVELDITQLDACVGFDANSNTYRDMWDAGILDPVKVTKSALVTAASIAGLVITTSVLIAPDEEKIPPMY